ncbi:MAG: FHA domain-containing protein [Ferribacterium limneticum]
MYDTPLRPLAGATPAAGEPANIYLVHAAVLKVSAQANAPDEALLEKLFRRRLSRLERVLASYGGSLIRKMPQGLLAAFDTAEAAVLVACEMQRRCAVIPQILETQIGLKIGIHPAKSGRDQSAGETAAARLATLLGEGSIVAAGTVVEALPEILRDKTALLVRENIGIAAHLVDWGTIPMLPAPAPTPPPRARALVAPPQTAKPPAVSLVLRQGERSYRFDGEKSVITIGRSPENDVVIRTPNASRQHCRIIYKLDNHVLVDLSMNGTFVKSGNAPEKAIRKNMVTLSGSGQIGFGHSCEVDGEQVFEFEIG